jgi:hypothetical protein
MKVFISHSSIDKKFVRTLKDDLSENNIETWFDEDELILGDSLSDKLELALEESSHFLIILSPTSVNSEWVRFELEKALKQNNSQLLQKIIPVKYSDCEVPKELVKFIYADLSHEVRQIQGDKVTFVSNGYSSFLNKLCKSIRNSEKELSKQDRIILRKEVEKAKITSFTIQNVECANISIDSKNCSWVNYDNVENAFINNHSDKSEFPILKISLINHTSKTILFKEIKLKAKHLYSGLSGIPQTGLGVLKAIAKYKIKLPEENMTSIFSLPDEIEVPAGKAFKFKIELFEQWNEEVFPIDGRKVLYFTFGFNNKLSINAPTIFLNCKSENEKMKIVEVTNINLRLQ